MLLYALTIFLGAFLLFQVQPVIAKIILPWFGGAAAVWSACMLFFQVVLLLGYLYAHFVVRRLRPKAQAVLHISLLCLSALLLHVMPSPAWKPSGGEDPVFRIVGLLTVSVGLPYFLLAATGPLLQAWYARASQVAFPYRLFAVSNLRMSPGAPELSRAGGTLRGDGQPGSHLVAGLPRLLPSLRRLRVDQPQGAAGRGGRRRS